MSVSLTHSLFAEPFWVLLLAEIVECQHGKSPCLGFSEQYLGAILAYKQDAFGDKKLVFFLSFATRVTPNPTIQKSNPNLRVQQSKESGP